MAQNNYGLFDSAYTAKKAAATVARWNDGIKRHTLYTVCGTTQDGWGIINIPTDPVALAAKKALWYQVGGTDPIPPDGERGPTVNLTNNDAAVGLFANPALFNWVPVSYPASMPVGPADLDNKWQPVNLSFVDSLTLGVKELTSLILATPGTFALVGMSQGAMVITKVLHAMMTPGNALAPRLGDCIAGVAMGNPFRKPGASFPGGVHLDMNVGGIKYTGGGLFATSSSLTNILSGNASVTTPDWWWELATPNDFFADSPITTIAGTAMGDLARAIVSVKGGFDALEIIKNVASALLNPGAITLSTALSLIQSLLRSDVRKIVGDWLSAFASTTVPNPHILYGVLSPPKIPTGLAGLTAKSTYTELAIAYMNARGRAIAPR